MRNYCVACGDILVEPFEYKYGLCMWCLSIWLEKLDNQLSDYWFDNWLDEEC